MAALTHIRVRVLKKHRTHTRHTSCEHVVGQPVSQGVSVPDRGRDWPTGAQVWGWVESAVLAGYGPGPASLL
ncbi:hypothetical protein B1R27_04935 [Streptomyces sp. GKU 895]|nr:hypothetical protein B1R27_04935 [Streptomyces sp. GKU 895]